jgi:hypothetical protein
MTMAALHFSQCSKGAPQTASADQVGQLPDEVFAESRQALLDRVQPFSTSHSQTPQKSAASVVEHARG